MKIHPSWLTFLLWICLVIGCAAPNSNRNMARPSPSPPLPANTDSHTRLEWSKKALQEKRFSDAWEQLDLIPQDAPEHKEAETLRAAARKGLDQRKHAIYG